MQRNAAQSPAEQRDGNSDECVVIPDRGRINSRQCDFEDESGECDQKNSDVRHRGKE